MVRLAYISRDYVMRIRLINSALKASNWFHRSKRLIRKTLWFIGFFKCRWDDITCFLQQWLYTFYTCWLEFCYSNDSTTRWLIILAWAIKMSTWFPDSKSDLITGKSFNQISWFYLPTCKIFFVRKHKKLHNDHVFLSF